MKKKEEGKEGKEGEREGERVEERENIILRLVGKSEMGRIESTMDLSGVMVVRLSRRRTGSLKLLKDGRPKMELLMLSPTAPNQDLTY